MQHPADALAERLGLPIRDRDLLAQALVHSSWLHEHPDAARGHNERLEFLGDAVVNLAVSEALFRRHPDDDEGVLSARRAAIVSTPGLARLAARIDLGDVPAARRGRGPAWRPRPAVAARLGVRGARRRDLPRPRLGGGARLDPRARGGRSSPPTSRSRPSRAPRAGSRSTPSGRPASGPSTACSRRSGRTTRSCSGSRSLVDGRVLGHRRGAVAPGRRDVRRGRGARGPAAERLAGTAAARSGRDRSAACRRRGRDADDEPGDGSTTRGDGPERR